MTDEYKPASQREVEREENTASTELLDHVKGSRSHKRRWRKKKKKDRKK